MERGNEECEFALLERQMEKAGKLCETERPNRLRISSVGVLHSVEEEDRYFLILHCAPAMVSVFNDILFPPNQTLSPTSFFTSPTRKFPRSRPNPILRCSIAEESTESRPKTGDSPPPPPLMEALAVCIAQALATKHANANTARDRVGGGNITTMESGGYLWEEGPNSFQPSDPMLTMVVDSGLKDQLVLGDPDAPRFVLWNGKLRPVPGKPTDLPFFDLMSIGGKIRAGFGVLGDGVMRKVEEFVCRNLGDDVFERLIEPFCSGWSIDLRSFKIKYESSIWESLEAGKNGGSIIGGTFKAIQERNGASKPPRDPHLPKPKGQTVGSFRKGLIMLPDAISARLGNKVKLSWKLSSISKLDSGEYSLTYETPEGVVSLQCKTVVLTIPSYVASTLLRPLSAAAADTLSKFYYPPVVAVSISYPKEAIRSECLIDGELKGFGAIYSSSLFSNRAPPGRTDSELVATVDRDLRKILINPNAQDPFVVGVRLWPQAIPQFLIGHLDLLDVAKASLRNTGFEGLFLGGNYVSGVALGRWVEGA
ncbi:Protoporphyrinogen oxidase 1, chloroplastic [Glycine max]|nr:Protoporphyrinogen oxidase 1, chloroplastic [Glycine max]